MENQEPTGQNEWLDRARSAFEDSTTYIDANYRTKWENNIRAFHSQHAKGSKYLTESYKFRSKLFRPKTRAAVRKTEAAAATAFFSTQDSVFIEPVNEADPMQLASSSVMKELLDYRLQKTIPWFLIVIGGIQNAQVTGVVCSYQYWKYKERRRKVKVDAPLVDPMTGQPVLDDMMQPVIEVQEQEEVEVIKDEPCCELQPIENIRFHPAASWVDPIGTSPYVIRMIPMYVYEVKQHMKDSDPKTGQPKWKLLSDQEILQAKNHNAYDSTRQERDQNREDPTEIRTKLSDFDVVWVHENFVNMGDGDQVYFTLGTQFLLTEPKPIKEVYFHGERPITLGYIVVEAHRPMPAGTVELGESLQKEANEIVNSRLDNVKLVLNKRWMVKRGKQVDTKSLVRNAAGSVTLVTDKDDVTPVEFNDVTASSYAEQDRVNVDYDELIGNFSAGSVQTNRKLNETVGGMSMLRSSAGEMTEYGLRVFVETWMEPTLRQLVKLEQYYETDEVVLGLAAEKAQLMQRYGVDTITDELLNQELTLKVNVGLGATNPMFKLERFLLALTKAIEILSQPPPGMNMERVMQEIFGLSGYKDGKAFFSQNPDVARLTQMVEQLQAELAQTQQAAQSKLEVEQMRQQGETERHNTAVMAKLATAADANRTMQ